MMKIMIVSIILAASLTPDFAMGISSSTFVAQEIKDFNAGNSELDVEGTGLTTANLNAATNIDYAMTADSYLIGVQLNVSGATMGDTLDIQVIDKDNILGHGSNFVVKSPVNGFPMLTDQQSQGKFSSVTPGAKILSGLYLRIVYHSTSVLTAARVSAAYAFQKVLY
jgi:hypothetical protein